MFKNTNYIIYIFLFIAFVLGVYRIYPYFDVNIALGYDPGIYRFMFLDYINNLPNINFDNLGDYTKGGLALYLGFFVNILYIIGFNIDIILSFGLGFFSIITSLFIYLLLRKYSNIAGLIGIMLFFLSIVQYEAFAMNYYKQIVGVVFFLSIFYLFEKEKYILSIPLIISVFTVHRPAGLFFLIVFIVYKIVDYFKYKKEVKYLERNINKKGNKQKLQNKKYVYRDIIIVFLMGVIATLMYLPLFKELILSVIKPAFTTVLSSGSSGTFFSIEKFLDNSYLFILISIYGLYLKIKNNDFDYVTIGYIVGGLWIVLKLFFYNRFLIFFDIFVILLSVYALWNIYKNNKKIFYVIFTIFFITQSYFYYNYVSSHNKAGISQKELENIKKINNIVPQNSYLMVNTRTRSPWVAGYTGKPTIAPGLFKYDLWQKNDWKDWWYSDGKKKCELLKSYKDLDGPVYIWLTEFYMGGKKFTENLIGATCLRKTELYGKSGDETFTLYKIEFDK